ncbi:hypothetical protein [Streptomyces coerulescens]|uniref:Uncharacterized protein n=1 Tax=Streptomyces coerulescens TaxID=29304 RepID=A0ABW0CW68_STRCD
MEFIPAATRAQRPVTLSSPTFVQEKDFLIGRIGLIGVQAQWPNGRIPAFTGGYLFAAVREVR